MAEKSRKQRLQQKQQRQQQRQQRRQQRRQQQRQRFAPKIEETRVQYYPTVSVFEVIIELIESLPDSRYFRSTGFEDFSAIKSNLISTFNDIIAESDDLENLENYYTSEFNNIQDKANIIKYDSESTTVQSAISALVSLIIGRPLSMEESDLYSTYSDAINGWG